MVRQLIVFIVLFACQAHENTGNVKGFSDGETSEGRSKAERGKDMADFQKCIEDVAQNQEDTLREDGSDPSCALTEENNVNWCADFATRRYITSRSGVLQFDLVPKDGRSSVYQRFVFSDIKACKCMAEKGMSLGLYGKTSNVRVGLGSFAKHAPSDRYTLNGVDRVYVQLLPDHKDIKPHTYYYCRLKITGYDGDGYGDKLPKKDDDGNLVPVPEESSTPIDGFRTADGEMHDRVTPLSGSASP